jgi:hypothetical protein
MALRGDGGRLERVYGSGEDCKGRSRLVADGGSAGNNLQHTSGERGEGGGGGGGGGRQKKKEREKKRGEGGGWADQKT